MFSSFGCSRILHSLSLSLSLRFAQLCFARALALLVPRSRLCSSRASSSASSLLVPRLSSLPGSKPLIKFILSWNNAKGFIDFKIYCYLLISISLPSRSVSVLLYLIRGFLIAFDNFKCFYKFHTVSFTNNVHVIFVI